MENKEFTTIQIYREDLKIITDKCKKNENLRDKLHEIMLKFHILNNKDDTNNKKSNQEMEDQKSLS